MQARTQDVGKWGGTRPRQSAYGGCEQPEVGCRVVDAKIRRGEEGNGYES